MKNISVKYNKLLTTHNSLVVQCNSFKEYILKNLVLTDGDKEEIGEDIYSNCSVFYQASDGFVFEINSHNAKLDEVIRHIIENGNITYEQYKYYRI